LSATAASTAETTTAVAAAEAMAVVKMTIVAETATTTTTFAPPPPAPTVPPSPRQTHLPRPSPALPVGGGRAARGGDSDDLDDVAVLPRWRLDAGNANANAHGADAVAGGEVIDKLILSLTYYLHYDFYLH